jgi:hypothetical protein
MNKQSTPNSTRAVKVRRERPVSKQHQVNRRRSYARRQHEVNEQTERFTRVTTWIEDPDPFQGASSSADLLAHRAAEAWLRIIGLA